MLVAVAAVLRAALVGCGAVEGGEDADDREADRDTAAEPARDCDPGAISLIGAATSPVIGTVGIIEWSTVMHPVTSAYIELGLDTAYGQRAPVDLNEPEHRTLLLGMKPSSVYHYRIVVNGCEGEDYTLETGAPPADLPEKTVSVRDEASSAGGFIVTSTGMKSRYAYILDEDGDYVWWYPFEAGNPDGRMDGIGRARMSADGKLMWAGTINVGCYCGYLYRIPMDGLGEQESLPVNRHHDFALLPDDTVATIEYTDDGDEIVERSESGAVRTAYRLRDDFTGDGIDWSHCNAIHYYPEDDSYTVSCLALNNIMKIDRSSGTLMWNLQSDSEGDFHGVSWDGQHGHQLLENGNVLLFTNRGAIRGETTDGGDPFGADGSEVLELSLNRRAGTITETWRYKGGTGQLRPRRCAAPLQWEYPGDLFVGRNHSRGDRFGETGSRHRN